ncbi:MAG: chorismate mutase [Microthrixaceae bacterium]
MNRSVRAVRGATTLEVDEAEHLIERVTEMLTEMIERNALSNDDIISVLFTATPDVHSTFPAVAGRRLGLGDVPLICAQELDIDGAMPLCIRVMMHVETLLVRDQVRHVYLHEARSLRDDLPG